MLLPHPCGSHLGSSVWAVPVRSRVPDGRPLSSTHVCRRPPSWTTRVGIWEGLPGRPSDHVGTVTPVSPVSEDQVGGGEGVDDVDPDVGSQSPCELHEERGTGRGVTEFGDVGRVGLRRGGVGDEVHGFQYNHRRERPSHRRSASMRSPKDGLDRNKPVGPYPVVPV